MENKKKIKIISDFLRSYLDKWGKEVILKDSYYTARGDLEAMENYLYGMRLTDFQQKIVNAYLSKDVVTIGSKKMRFIIDEPKDENELKNEEIKR